MKKILVIEDEKFIRENILDLLQGENFNAIGAANGREGVRIAQEQLPDLIICDILMPELNGYEVLKTLQQNSITARIPFIFLTAKMSKTEVRQGMTLGADDYLTKPFSLEELLNAISARLKKHATITQTLKQATESVCCTLHYGRIKTLPNRLLLRQQFKTFLAAESDTPHSVPILFLKLDQFNRINDWLLENQNRNEFIKQITKRITSCLSSKDILLNPNIDEFAIILANIHQKRTITSISKAILASLNEPFNLEIDKGIKEQLNFICLTASIGISLYPEDGRDIDILLKKANSAMHQAQKLGVNNYQFYTTYIEKTNISDSQALLKEFGLRRALERGEFQVYYQPVVNLSTGKISGAEALVRWLHPERGIISPGEFIPLAESSGLIIPMGEWTLQTACAQAQKWHKSGYKGFWVSVNLSGRQFSQPHLLQRIEAILETTGLNPTALQLELTESTLVENVHQARTTLERLRNLGLRIAIDDFGTGYASLSYLKQFPFDTLKIDRSFVCNADCDTQNSAILTAMIQMSHKLHLKVTVEGVETDAELAFLRQQQCDDMQGFLFSRPLPAAEFERLLVVGKQLSVKSRELRSSGVAEVVGVHKDCKD